MQRHGGPPHGHQTGHHVHVLHPGDVACGLKGDRLQTLLGSCLAIILTDRARTVGAMCHIVHARQPAGNASDSTAYADNAWRRMFALLEKHGMQPLACEAYVYGGGNMFPALYRGNTVGDQNVRWAFDTLAAHRIPIVEQCVGRPFYRKLSWTVGPDAPHVIAERV